MLSELLEEEVDELVGPKGNWNPSRAAVRHGHEDGEGVSGPGLGGLPDSTLPKARTRSSAR